MESNKKILSKDNAYLNYLKKVSGMELLKVEIVTDGGPWAEHNMPCAVCYKQYAVIQLNTWRFHPCWDCQKQGFNLTHAKSKLSKWILSFFNI